MQTAQTISSGFSPERLARIRPVMQRYVGESKFAGGLTMVARRGQVFHLECFGLRDVQAGEPVEEDTIFRIYSMTKPITSVAVMMLLEEGCFRIDDPISQYIPAFKDMQVIARTAGKQAWLEDAAGPVTIHHLLTHTAGLSYGFDETDYLDGLYRKKLWARLDKLPAATLKDAVDILARLPLRFHPGTAFHYSFAIDVLGYLVEVVSGEPFDRFLRERIFDPLGMPDTGFWVPPEKAARLTHMYGPDEKNPGRLKDIDPHEKSDYTRPRTFFSGGGGLVSTAGDYLRFCQMLLNGGALDGVRLLGRKTVEYMLLNHLPNGVFLDQNPAMGFGLGGAVALNPAHSGSLNSPGCWGWGGAANTKFWIDPQEQLIGILMLQLMPSDLYPIATDFRNLVYQALVD
jgi:CubicO group peptidase (beta-lactamase class C family)